MMLTNKRTYVACSDTLLVQKRPKSHGSEVDANPMAYLLPLERDFSASHISGSLSKILHQLCHREKGLDSICAYVRA